MYTYSYTHIQFQYYVLEFFRCSPCQNPLLQPDPRQLRQSHLHQHCTTSRTAGSRRS
uniref:Uncharacterized protein n=1 Tax=Arundo donax TaxID=35708 RepID=A0A0A9EKG0_ARUDO